MPCSDKVCSFHAPLFLLGGQMQNSRIVVSDGKTVEVNFLGPKDKKPFATIKLPVWQVEAFRMAARERHQAFGKFLAKAIIRIMKRKIAEQLA
jgi:hypothetical protein